MKRAILIVVLTLAGMVAVGLLSITHEGENQHGSSSRAQPWQERLLARGQRQLEGSPGNAPALSTRFGSPEGIPSETRTAIAGNLRGERRLELKYDDAQSLRAPAHVHLWLVEGRAVACLFVAAKPAPASTCRTSVQAAVDGLSIGTYKTDPKHPGKPTQFLAAGIDPRGVSSLKVVVGGKPKRIPVYNGVWAIRAKAPILPSPSE